jgi:hypothetical protein
VRFIFTGWSLKHAHSLLKTIYVHSVYIYFHILEYLAKWIVVAVDLLILILSAVSTKKKQPLPRDEVLAWPEHQSKMFTTGQMVAAHRLNPAHHSGPPHQVRIHKVNPLLIQPPQ